TSSTKLRGTVSAQLPLKHALPLPQLSAQSLVGVTHWPLARQVVPDSQNAGRQAIGPLATLVIVQSVGPAGLAMLAVATIAELSTCPGVAVDASMRRYAMTGTPSGVTTSDE